MKLEEAKGRLQHLYKENKDTLAVFSTTSKVKEDYLKENEAIEIVLQELDRLQKENKRYENKIILSDEEYRRVIDEAQKDCVQKDKIKELIVKWKPKLKEIDKKVEKAKNQEERVVLHCIGLRVDERIKTLEDLLKEE